MPSNVRKVLSLVAEVGNNNNSMGVYVDALSVAFRQKGLEADTAHVRDPDFLQKIFTAAQEPGTVIYFSNFFMDLRLNAQLHYTDARLNDLFNCKTVGMVADQPFISFMWERIINCHPETLILVADNAFVEQAKAIQPALGHFRFTPAALMFDDTAKNPPHAEREIDVLLPLGNVKAERFEDIIGQFNSSPQALQLVEATYEGLRGRVEKPAFDTFKACFQDVIGSSFLDVMASNRQAGFELFNMLSQVDRVTRNERRRNIVGQLLADPGDLKVHLVGDFSDLPEAQHANIVNHGFIPADELCELMSNSKAVVHTHPNLTECLHERVVNAAGRGCLVVSEYAPVIEKALGKEWVETTGQTIASIFAELGNDRIEEMGQAARQRIYDNHTMSHHADDFIAGLAARWG